MLKIVGIIIAVFGMILPGMKYSRSERWSSAKSFFKWLLWFLLGIGIAGIGVYIFRLGES